MAKGCFEALYRYSSIMTAYPPAGDVRPGVDFDSIKEKISLTHAHFMPEDLPGEKIRLIEVLHHLFATTQNPFFALEALLLSNESGFYPPIWVLEEWLLPAFHRFYSERGERESIGDLLHIKGGATVFRDAASDIQSRQLMHHVYINHRYFGVPVSKVARALSERLKTKVWDASGLNMGGVSESRLRTRYYSERWEALFDEEQILALSSHEEKLAYLRIFNDRDQAKILKKFAASLRRA